MYIYYTVSVFIMLQGLLSTLVKVASNLFSRKKTSTESEAEDLLDGF